MFDELGIKFNGPYPHETALGKWYTIEIRKKSELVKFGKKIGSFHVDKSKKLKQMVSFLEKKRNYGLTSSLW